MYQRLQSQLLAIISRKRGVGSFTHHDRERPLLEFLGLVLAIDSDVVQAEQQVFPVGGSPLLVVERSVLDSATNAVGHHEYR